MKFNGKKGKSKKGKEARLKAEALLRAQQEEEERLERERLYQERLEKLEAKYQGERESELAELHSLEQKFLSAQHWKMDYREQAKWEHYLSCDGTPDPTVPQEINTFMSLWRDDQDVDVQLVMEKKEVVLNLIEKLEFLLLEAAPEEITDTQRDQYQEVILQLQDLLHQKYNDATQNLLKIASMYEDSETGNMHTVLKDKNVTFCIWANLKKKVRFKDHVFQDAGHGFELPLSLALSSVAVRVLHTNYDHLSPLWVQCQGLPRPGASDSMELAEHPEDTGQEPGEEAEKGREEPSVPAAEEMGSKGRKESSASLKGTSNNTDEKKETEEETEKNSDILDAPSQEEEALLQEEPGGREEAPQVVDLEQLVPVGGVYHISALQLPPQAQDVGNWTMVELLDVGLEVYPYSPGQAEDGTREAVQITLGLPDNVIYFKVPVVGRWDPAGQWWRTDGISKITYEAEEKSITFSMGDFHTVALLQDAHLNLPYQAWELHPTGVDEGLFTITAVFATIQIRIKDNQCMLSSVVVEEEEVLSHITGKWMSPFALRAALKRAGVNIFPAEYSPKYVPVPRKAALAEVKAYEQMALLAAAFAFAHSKWNGEAGPEQVVFKVSEHLTAGSAKGNHWYLLMFNGEKVQHLKLTETSEAFSEKLEDESQFHSTLYHMVKDSASNEAMDKVERAGFLFIDSVYQLLLATRVLAYS
ncbi:dynein axonemal intermediate chain 7-like isoform X3 [Haemorhous mexicanus]|uniref:dynein axonemal intermediate chain 7-like isoform X3 n=1 Tax=Haemorhous mexicanus TaxID=30427 RepID=UPI0028BD570A|nr:dynein axonemal intermediate chain 7-like isoform X3 [Haemorhous mexicanus]